MSGPPVIRDSTRGYEDSRVDLKEILASAGTQRKYYDNGYWYKENNLGYEGYAEYLASKVLECSNVNDFVNYEECKETVILTLFRIKLL